jgi:uncharacterized protein YndB with AHSA1/START domain
MKKLLIAFGAIFFLIACIWIYGASLPANEKVAVSKEIKAPPDEIWAVMTDWAAQPEWRDDVKSVKVIDRQTFIEYPKRGPEIHFKVARLEPSRFLELTLTGPFSGTYQVTLSEKDGITHVEEVYSLHYPSPVGRILSKLFFDIEAFAEDYLSKLEQRVTKK